MISKFSVCSPTDYRYFVRDLGQFLSAEAYVRYLGTVERALAETLVKHGVCPARVAVEVAKATSSITARDVEEEEKRVKHDVRALVNVIQRKVSDVSRPYVHLSATSYDIVDTARALMYKSAIESIVIPDMVVLEKVWIDLARRESHEVQIGRTHGQFAEPITFGFAVAQYVNRWGNRVLEVKRSAERLVGKFSGAVGAYNATSAVSIQPENTRSPSVKCLNHDINGCYPHHESSRLKERVNETETAKATKACHKFSQSLSDRMLLTPISEIDSMVHG